MLKDAPDPLRCASLLAFAWLADCGEDTGPRQICSGLRPFYTQEQMVGHRLLVVANLKAKNLKGFKSHGMVLCASQGDKVQFIEVRCS